MRVINSLVAAVLSTQPVLGAFLPVSTFNEAASLTTREENVRKCLQPVSSVDLYYMEEYQTDVPYVVQVTASHDNATYVSVESFEHLLADFSCSSSGLDNTSTLVFAFNTTESMTVARKLWSSNTELLFITHHATCNSLDERAVYKASTITYNLDSLVAVVTAQLSPLGKSPEASSRLRLQGGPLNAELRKKLRRRSSLEEYSAIAKRAVETSDWIMDLNEFGKFDPREDIIGFGDMNIACVGCSLQGKVGAYFDLDVNFADLTRLNNPFNLARLRLETLEAIDGNFNIEVAGNLTAQVSCSFPGGCLNNRANRPGKKFRDNEKPRRNATEIAGFTFSGNFSLGLSVGLQATLGVNVTLPIKVNVPANKKLGKTFFGPGSDSSDLADRKYYTVGNPIFAKDQVREISVFVAIGPSITLSAVNGNTEISATASLDLPRVELGAALVSDVTAKCEARGPFKDAVKIFARLGAGLRLSTKATILGVGIPGLSTDVKGLYWTWTLLNRCFDISGDTEGGDKTLLPSSDKPEEKDPSTDEAFGVPGANGTITAGGAGNTTASYDCSGVAPSPGGQPCGNVVMQCPSMNTWSCGSGQQGIVPPGTICVCGAFRYLGWLPPTVVKPTCTQGIVCVSDKTFSVCSPAGIEAPQPVAPGTLCQNGGIIAA